MSDTTDRTTDTTVDTDTATDLHARLQAYVGREVGPAQVGPDAVNVAMIRHWVQALGDTNPVYVDEEAAAASVHGGLVAPPTMLQAWVMRPYGVDRNEGGPTPYTELTDLVEAAGFTSVVASNCEQTYDRYLRPGDEISMRVVVDSISPEKTTALGAGHFITTRQDYYDAAGERVGSMLFRILRFRPAAKAAAAPTRPLRPRPSTTHDMEFFFNGLQDGKLLIQRCANCGALRHPPGPMCRECRSLEWNTLQSAGHGTIHSFVVVHYPQVPSFDYPNQVVLVELDEGVRIVANTIDIARDQLVIGSRVELVVQECDPELSLPFFRLADNEIAANGTAAAPRTDTNGSAS